MNRRDNMPSGRPQQVDDSEILSAIMSHPDEAVTAKEVAKSVGMTNAGVLKRLDDLSERGTLRKKEVGANAVVWWIVD